MALLIWVYVVQPHYLYMVPIYSRLHIRAHVRAHMCKPAGSGPAVMCHAGSFKHLCRLHVGVSENPLVIQIEWIELMATLRLQVLV